MALIIIGGVVVVLLVSRKGAPLSSEPPVPKSETVKLDAAVAALAKEGTAPDLAR